MVFMIRYVQIYFKAHLTDELRPLLLNLYVKFRDIRELQHCQASILKLASFVVVLFLDFDDIQRGSLFDLNVDLP